MCVSVCCVCTHAPTNLPRPPTPHTQTPEGAEEGARRRRARWHLTCLILAMSLFLINAPFGSCVCMSVCVNVCVRVSESAVCVSVCVSVCVLYVCVCVCVCVCVIASPHGLPYVSIVCVYRCSVAPLVAHQHHPLTMSLSLLPPPSLQLAPAPPPLWPRQPGRYQAVVASLIELTPRRPQC